MKNFRLTITSLLLAALMLAPVPSFAVSKEIVQLQTQVQALQDAMARMQQAFDERMGVMRNLVEGSTDKMNQINSSLQELNKNLASQHNDSGARADQLSSQVQALHDSVDELKARMNKIATTLEAMQAAQANLPSNTAPAGQPMQPGTSPNPQPTAPPPDVLYNNALRDYNAAKYDLASQEFGDYIKYYPNTDLAGNAYYYLADIEFRQGNYQQAAKDYDQVLQNFPSGNKAAAAQLKKGFSLIELGQKEDGVTELRHVIQRYPRSPEATQAQDRLRKLGVTSRAR